MSQNVSRHFAGIAALAIALCGRQNSDDDRTTAINQLKRVCRKVAFICLPEFPKRTEMDSISDNVELRSYDLRRPRGHLSYSRQFMMVLLSLLTAPTQGCSMNEKMIEEHERICKQNMKVIVHDNDLWREYRAQSEAAYQKEMHETPPMMGRTYYNSIGEFKISFGEKKSYFRPNVDGNIVRDDIFIMKGDKVVAQIVDYIYQYWSIDGPTGFNCLKFYKDLSIGGVDK